MKQEIYNRLCCRPCFNPGVAIGLLDNVPALPPTRQPITVILANGYPLAANGLLNIGNGENGVAVNGYEFHDQPITDWYNGSNADVLLLDICMPVPNGIAVIQQLLARFPEAKIIVLSNEDDPGVIKCMQSLGVNAYQIKTQDHNDTIQTIIKVHAGEKVFPENLEDGIVPLFVRRLIDPPANPELSTREIQVLKLIAKGKTNPQIAAELNISPLTVKKHRENLLRKLNAHNTAQLISKGRLKGLL